jgi:hypothetical protein
MRPFDRAASVLILASGGLLAACSNTPAPPPVVSLDARICTARPDLAGARALPLEAPSDGGVPSGKGVTVPLAADAACLKPAGGEKRVYALFKLPESAAPYIITIASDPVGSGLLSPYAETLDQEGRVLRVVQRDSFMFHGAALAVGLRSHPEEQYLLVASDPASVGQTVSQIAGTTQVTTSGTGTIFFTLHTGSETTRTLTYAHSGSITVKAAPVPKAN